MQRLLFLALLAAAAPAASALDDSLLVQAAVARDVAGVAAEARDVAGEAVEANAGDAVGASDGSSGDAVGANDLLLTVRPIYGEDFPFTLTLQKGQRLQVLMRSVCKKMGIEFDAATFTKKGRHLDPMRTATESDVSSGDVIEVSTAKLLREKYFAMHMEQLGRQAPDEPRGWESAKTGKFRKVGMKLAKLKGKADLMEEISLRFVSPTRGEDVFVALRRDNWLDDSLSLAAHHMGLDRAEARFFFKDENTDLSVIEPYDTPNTLGLENEESILVKILRK